ncbi:ABC transporter substrate-binding protein [Bdellovibrio sp. KM01]|uniref:substrate-binding periplasmic protein n=1 Tax=Bdellovibrio sp. KM01 TaxID=2748865 RepID=UPI0015E9436E|nr:transporter substrate-binding domain-containing protein [Bdellovibrio sp. KM01]QLY25065.1 transporter substrate-binding domain-containing protein [Bdellovibrio sp. KM01]
MWTASISLLISILLLNTPAAAERPPCGVNFRTSVNESPPLYFPPEPGGKPRGITIDIIEELRKRTGCEFTITSMNRSRTAQSLKSSSLDLVLLDSRNITYDKHAKFILLRHSARKFLVNLKTPPATPLTVDELMNNPKFKFIIQPGGLIFFKQDEATKIEKQQRFITMPNLPECFKKLKTTENAVFASQSTLINYYLGDHPEFTLVEDNVNVFDSGAYYVPRKGIQAGIVLIEKALADLVKDGTLNKIIDQYLRKPK